MGADNRSVITPNLTRSPELAAIVIMCCLLCSDLSEAPDWKVRTVLFVPDIVAALFTEQPQFSRRSSTRRRSLPRTLHAFDSFVNYHTELRQTRQIECQRPGFVSVDGQSSRHSWRNTMTEPLPSLAIVGGTGALGTGLAYRSVSYTHLTLPTKA